MLASLTVTNYRAFADATVPLGPLTAFVGPNASGKSSLLRACVGGSFAPADVHNKTGMGLVRRVDDAGQVVELRFGEGHEGTLAELGPILRLRAEAMWASISLVEAKRLSESGNNLANVLGTMPRRQLEQLSKRFAELVPVFADVDVRPAAQPGTHRVIFQDRWRPKVWYEPHEVSDGSLLVLALCALQFQIEPPAMVAIEEPDHGLHPYLLSRVVEVLRALATDRTTPIQVVLATQSSELLDLLHPDEVRFLTRQEDGTVRVDAAPLDTPAWKDAWDAHHESLGNLWLSGTAGGVP